MYPIVLHAPALLLALSITAAAQQDCSSSSPAQSANSLQNQTICLQNGTQRNYTLYLPPDYASGSPTSLHPLILSFHGGTVTPANQIQLDLLTTPFFNQDAVVAYPSGLGNTWQGVPSSSANDTGFTTELLDLLLQQYKIDKTRIWATGKSDGAGFVGVLACDPILSTRIAAFAPVSGAFYPGKAVTDKNCNASLVNNTCAPGRSPIPFIEFHGLLDDVIPYYGGKHAGECLPTIPHYLVQWAGRDSEGSTGQVSNITNDTVVNTFPGGLVKGYLDSSLFHEWPSTTPNPDNRPHHHVATYNATTIILDFFRQNTLNSSSPSGVPNPKPRSSATSMKLERANERAAFILPLLLLSAFFCL